MSDNYLLNLYRKTRRIPKGRELFSLIFSRKAPYFRTVRPLIAELRPNYCEVHIKKRKAVENHIGTVHVIAICNALEAAMGAMAEASIPKHLRWIPKGMDVHYTAKASSDIVATAEVAADAWENGPDLPVTVTARRDDGTVVVAGTIHLWITEKPARDA
ncbi:Thioesterase (4HBT) superfamily enzyme [Alloalcanivorax dieselolei B5]|uniref:Thioesterase (4HBT) superfamily enzyme n=1 Tax=Alcanivorax dieselolei (strain DSM 16502 / CGMCC 1.3690 / MCCC 1A00001 / B-5) TaxID=930169 RepID=K0CCB9_ALCDB|nr:hotdog fold domain-containing protein [Alloalcanivorax dieselolei]AFT71219.1 Thioesterase (4HBT) superfamily enzyme [Alloalcanivorax dieselolei B5]GGJ93987.1 thioesterase [Alloalcanivorax dieselolei]